MDLTQTKVLELEDQINALLEMFWKLEKKKVKKTSSKNEILEDRLDYLEEESRKDPKHRS